MPSGALSRTESLWLYTDLLFIRTTDAEEVHIGQSSIGQGYIEHDNLELRLRTDFLDFGEGTQLTCTALLSSDEQSRLLRAALLSIGKIDAEDGSIDQSNIDYGYIEHGGTEHGGIQPDSIG